MQVAAIILTVIAVYVAALAFCRVAADADAQASRYYRRTLQARNNVQCILTMAPAGNARVEVLRGR
jgi:hypothetical protein